MLTTPVCTLSLLVTSLPLSIRGALFAFNLYFLKDWPVCVVLSDGFREAIFFKHVKYPDHSCSQL